MDDGDRAGSSVSGIGDFNGDGFDDFLIGAPYADAGFGHGDGKAYLVLGGTDPSGTRALGDLDGSDGVPFFAVAAGDRAGQGVGAAGDINGDGFADAVITAPRAGYDGNTNVGATYVVFGHTTATGNGTFDLSDLSGSDGFVVKGVGANDYSGIAVSGGGDFNGDGFDDLLIGADPAPNLTFYGATYVVFGGSGVGASGLIELSDLDGSNGFTINGTAEEADLGLPSIVPAMSTGTDTKTSSLAIRVSISPIARMRGRPSCSADQPSAKGVPLTSVVSMAATASRSGRMAATFPAPSWAIA